jgi:hypothetical protein
MPVADGERFMCARSSFGLRSFRAMTHTGEAAHRHTVHIVPIPPVRHFRGAQVIHPIFKTVLRHPELLVKHAQNYFELLRAEASAIGTGLALRAAGVLLALVAVLLALGLSAVAVMLGFLEGFHWVLIAVPGAAWVLAFIGMVLAMRSPVKTSVEDVRDEMEADMRMLRLVKESENV